MACPIILLAQQAAVGSVRQLSQWRAQPACRTSHRLQKAQELRQEVTGFFSSVHDDLASLRAEVSRWFFHAYFVIQHLQKILVFTLKKMDWMELSVYNGSKFWNNYDFF